MHLLVTGGCGYIGSHFVRRALAAGHSIDVIDNLSHGKQQALPDSPLVNLITEDIADSSWAKRLTKKPSLALHFAGFIEVAESIKNPPKYIENNFTKAQKWTGIAQNLGIGKFVFSSTAAVYGTPQKTPIPESAPLEPINPYGESKLKYECFLQETAVRDSDFRYVILRYFNAAGASLDGKHGEDHNPESHLIPRAIKAALSGETLVINGRDYQTPDGTCMRDFIHIDDLASAHLSAVGWLMKDKPSEIFNVGTGQGKTILEVVKSVEKCLKKQIKIQWGERRLGDPPALVADPAKISRHLQWEPRLGLDETVQTALEWHRSHPKGYQK